MNRVVPADADRSSSYDGSKVSFAAKLDRQKRISVQFLSEDGEGFEITGAFSMAKELGAWESQTASCGGAWHAERSDQ